MKKQITIPIIILMTGLIIAQGVGVTTINKEITLDKTLQTEARELNLTDITYKDYEKDGLYMRCLISNTDFQLPCSDYINQSKLDTWMNERIKGILEVNIIRKESNEKVLVKDGGISLNAK